MSAASRLATIKRIESSGIIAVIRSNTSAQLVPICEALSQGGVEVMEITMTTPGALDAIAAARKALGDSCIIGVGSVLDPETAQAAITAGAQFVFAPTLNLSVIEMTHRHSCPVIPGAMTPTEIQTATQAGADMVKVFPANHFGPQYFKDLLAPMPHLKLTPTGGVNLDTAADWLSAGAAALGVGSAMVKKEFIENQDWTALSNLASQYRDIVKSHRGQ